MKKLLLLAFCITFLSCEKEGEPEDHFNRDTLIEFSVQNSNGEDLLDPEHPDGLASEDILIFHEINGEKIEVYESHLDHPRHFFIFKHESEYRMRLFPNASEAETMAITYVQWNETDTDTLAVTYERTTNSIIRKEVWLNEVLVFDRADDLNSDPFIHITK